MILGVLSLALWLSLIAGAVLLFRGVRGRPVFTEPRCVKCRYDLRAIDPQSRERCPECGADLTQPHAVRFGDYAKNPRLIKIGAAMAGVPLLLMGAVLVQAMLGYQWEDFYTTDRIIARLATTADSPWDWNRLERRYQQGRLTRQQVADSVEQLIAFIESRGRQQPLSWGQRYVELIDRNNLISPEQYVRLAQAFYEKPEVRGHTKVRSGGKVSLHLQHSPHWDLPGVRRVAAITAITADGKTPLTLISHNDPNAKKGGDADYLSLGNDWTVSGEMDIPLEPGEHDLAFTFAYALVGESEPRGTIAGRPGQPHRWKNTRCRWETVIHHKLTVTPADVSPVVLVTDPALDPMKAGALRIESILVKPHGNRVCAFVPIAVGAAPVVMSFDVSLRIGGKLHKAGSLHCGVNSSYTQTLQLVQPSLDPALTEVDVVFQPSRALAERAMDSHVIWGGEVVLEKVKLVREDMASP